MNRPSPASRTSTDDTLSLAVAKLRPLIEQALASACQLEPGCPGRLADAIRYAVLTPGKRLRPCLVLIAAEACGGTIQDAMPGAVAVELIHAYSLIHDDLPAMDDDDLRRGRPTVHIAFDEATAILAGDALQPMAFEYLAANVSDAGRAAMAIEILARAAGPTRLVGGQADDLSAERLVNQQVGKNRGEQPSAPFPGDGLTLESSLEHLESIHRRKTGALFAAAMDLGAILVGAGDPARTALGNYASELGLAFQIADDLLDHTAGEAELGKRTGKDASRGKLTFPSLLGVGSSRLRVQELVESARRHASFFGDAAWRLNSLADYVLERSH